MKIGLAQLNTHVGAIDTNTKKVLATARRARDEFDCDLVVFPELTLSGYPPEDLLLHGGMRRRVEAALEEVRQGAEASGFMSGFRNMLTTSSITPVLYSVTESNSHDTGNRRCRTMPYSMRSATSRVAKIRRSSISAA